MTATQVTTAAPRLAEDAEMRATARGMVLAAPDGRAYCELEPPAAPLLAAMTGSATVEELTERFGTFVPALIEDLRREGYLADSPAAPAQPWVTVTGSGVEFAGADRLVSGALYRLLRPLCNPVGLALLTVLAVVGMLSPAVGWLDLRSAATTADPVSTAVFLLVLQTVIVVVHELGHAVVLAHYGRRVGRVGFGLYWGGLSFYVDASAALLLPTRARRVLQSGAGLLVEGALAGLFVLIAEVTANPTAVAMLHQAAAVACLGVLLNATPLLQLDGYWLLSDVLDEPNLYRRALRALASPLRSRRHLLLAGYAAAGLVFGVALLVGGVGLWISFFGGLIADLWSVTLLGQLLAVVLLLPAVGLALQLMVLATNPLRRTRHNV